MQRVAEQQGSLNLRVVRPVVESLTDEQVAALPTLTAACFRCIDTSGLQDKVICLQLDIDAPVLSRARSGAANFPPDKIDDLMNLCGNEIPLRWQNLRRGYGMVRLKSAVEMENEKLRAELADQRKKLDTITEFMREVRA